MKNSESRLHRLVESDICQAGDVEEYREELLQLASTVAAIDTVKRQSKFFKALADEKRLRIVKLLRVRPMCVCELMIALEMSQPNLSHHLQILENEKLITRTKKGKWVYCSLDSQDTIEQMVTIHVL